MVSRVERPYDLVRFFRFGAARLSLGGAADRSGLVGFSAGEGWRPVSGVFALPLPAATRLAGAYSDVYRDVYRGVTRRGVAQLTVGAVWRRYRGGTDAVLTAAIDRELRSAGYTRPDGSPIS